MDFNRIPQHFIKKYLNKRLVGSIEKEYDELNNFKPDHELLNYILVLFGICFKQFHSKSRLTKLVVARQLFCYFSLEETGQHLKEIGYITMQYHSTVIYSKGKVIEDYKQERIFKINGLTYKQLFEMIRDRNNCL
jgi:chromosomal replication initiation ATPase DnaA